MIELSDVIEYWQTRRGCGHSRAQLKGIENADRVVVIVNSRENEGEVKRLNPRATVMTVESDFNRLRGSIAPLVIDHFAVEHMFRRQWERYQRTCEAYASEIERLKAQILYQEKMLGKRDTEK